MEVQKGEHWEQQRKTVKKRKTLKSKAFQTQWTEGLAAGEQEAEQVNAGEEGKCEEKKGMGNESVGVKKKLKQKAMA